MMAAIHAARAGASVTIYEKNERCGRKLRITGKGRCNLTNHCARDAFFAHVTGDPRFLYSAWSRFDSAETERFFEEAGVPLKVERGNRVFPVSDNATDVVDALTRLCREAGVLVRHACVEKVVCLDGAFALTAGGKEYTHGAVILATGGASYPLTGSTGDGYRFAAALGHTVVPIEPSLVPLTEIGNICASMQGLSLKNVGLSFRDEVTGKTVFEDRGEMLFTHFGLSGPLVLSGSAHLRPMAKGRYTAHIDLKPALDEKTLDARLLSDFERYRNRDLINAFSDLLPQKMIAPFLRQSGVDPRKKINAVTREERAALLGLLKDFSITVGGFRPIEEAIVTHGGVKLSEVSPRTMASRLVIGLYFAGEVLDLDAYTGGFNLQIAFSTGVLAGESAAAYLAEKNKEESV